MLMVLKSPADAVISSNCWLDGLYVLGMTRHYSAIGHIQAPQSFQQLELGTKVCLPVPVPFRGSVPEKGDHSADSWSPSQLRPPVEVRIASSSAWLSTQYSINDAVQTPARSGRWGFAGFHSRQSKSKLADSVHYPCTPL